MASNKHNKLTRTQRKAVWAKTEENLGLGWRADKRSVREADPNDHERRVIDGYSIPGKLGDELK